MYPAKLVGLKNCTRAARVAFFLGRRLQRMREVEQEEYQEEE